LVLLHLPFVVFLYAALDKNQIIFLTMFSMQQHLFSLLYSRYCYIYGFVYSIVSMYLTNWIKLFSLHNHEIGMLNARVNETHLDSVAQILHDKLCKWFEMDGMFGIMKKNFGICLLICSIITMVFHTPTLDICSKRPNKIHYCLWRCWTKFLLMPWTSTSPSRFLHCLPCGV